MIPNPHNTYLKASVETASPERLLVMLVDRLVRDVEMACDALRAGDGPGAHAQLVHAQDVVSALETGLRPELWDGAHAMSSIYSWLSAQLVRANIEKDLGVAEHCLSLARQIADTWRAAALEVAKQSA